MKTRMVGDQADWATWLSEEKVRNDDKRRQVWAALRANGQVIWSDALGRYVTIPE